MRPEGENRPFSIDSWDTQEAEKEVVVIVIEQEPIKAVAVCGYYSPAVAFNYNSKKACF